MWMNKRTCLLALMALFLFPLGAYADVKVYPDSITGDASAGFTVNWSPGQSKAFDSDNTEALGLVALGCAQAHLNNNGFCRIVWKLQANGRYKITVTLYDEDPIKNKQAIHIFSR